MSGLTENSSHSLFKSQVGFLNSQVEDADAIDALISGKKPWCIRMKCTAGHSPISLLSKRTATPNRARLQCACSIP